MAYFPVRYEGSLYHNNNNKKKGLKKIDEKTTSTTKVINITVSAH